MIKLSVKYGICNISSFAFGCYGAWLVTEPSFDIEQGYSMGRVAIEMMRKLNAVEVCDISIAYYIALQQRISVLNARTFFR